MKKRLSIRLVASLILSAMLFTLPAAAMLLNRNAAIPVYADEENAEEGVSANSVQEEETKKDDADAENPENQENPNVPENNETTDDPQNITESGENDPGNPGEENKEVENPEAPGDEDKDDKETDKPGEEEKDDPDVPETPGEEDEEEKEPNVSILIKSPAGWLSSGTNAKVTFEVKDIADTGNFILKEVRAKIGQNGNYTEVTEDMSLEISENCTVYVLAVDVNGKGYEKSKAIKCFDTVKPTLNAAVSDGLLSIQAVDSESGVKVVYVNGYEFNEFTNGTINIRLSQFDAGYEYFTIQAMDTAGNMSEVYKTKNPYYKDPESKDDSDPAKQLPVSAEATKPATATATVTDHTKTEGQGSAQLVKTSQSSGSTLEDQKKKELAMADSQLINPSGSSQNMNLGKEFYTIEAASGKVFYLIIDRDGQEEVVHFLTDITENDLLNVTNDNSETLPKNSAALESQIPVTESALPNNNTDKEITREVEVQEEPDGEEPEEQTEEDPESTEEPVKNNTVAGYIILAILAAGAIGAAYYVKVVKRRQEGDFVEDEDDDEDDSDYDDDEVKENEPDDQDKVNDLRTDNKED